MSSWGDEVDGDGAKTSIVQESLQAFQQVINHTLEGGGGQAWRGSVENSVVTYSGVAWNEDISAILESECCNGLWLPSNHPLPLPLPVHTHDQTVDTIQIDRPNLYL